MTIEDPWKYDADHHFLRSVRGSAKSYKCVDDCGRQAEEWSCVHDTDPADIYSYVPRCIICHRAYDRPPLKTVCASGHDLTRWGKRVNGTCAVCARLAVLRLKGHTACEFCGYQACRCPKEEE